MYRNWVPYFFYPPDAGDGGGAAGADSGQPADRGADDVSTDDSGDLPDDGAGDGDADPDAPGGGSRVDDFGGDDDEDDDGDDEDLATATPEDRAKRYRTRARRAQRQARSMRPIAERFRGPDGKFLPPQDVDRMVGRARDMEELEQFFSEHSDIVQTILERKRGGRSAASARAEDAFIDPFADEASLPWDTTQPGGKALVEHLRRQARENHELRQTLKGIEQRFTQVDQRETQRTVAQHEERWKSLTLNAVKQVPEASRTTFANAVHRAFKLLEARGQLGRVDPRKVVMDELRPFIRAARGEKRRTTADAQRRAENNNNRPAPTRARTAPADPHATNSVGTIRDGKKSFFARLGMGTPR